MKIRHNQDLTSFQILTISYDIGEPIVHAGLERGTTLNFIIGVVELQDVRVVVEQLILRNVTALHSLKLIISNFDDFISIIDVAFDEVIEV